MSFAKIGSKEFKRISEFITNEVGIKMPDSKVKLVENRLYKRLKENKLSSFKEYVDFVFSNDGKEELNELIDCMATNQTYFFRENVHFEFLERWIAEKKRNKSLKIWSAASSSGDEAYSMAILLEEMKRKGQFNGLYSIVGTDISNHILQKAEKGVFNANHLIKTPEAIQKQYFSQQENGLSKTFHLKDSIKKAVNFRRLNLMKDLRLIREKYDVIFCRNVLIYFELSEQKRIVSQLIEKLNAGGILILGHCESMAAKGQEIVSLQPTIYEKR